VNSVHFLKELWRRRILVVVAVLVAGAAASAVVLTERGKVEAEGSIQVLVDSANSPIANARRDLSGLTARAGVFARVMSGGNVISQVAAATDIPYRQIQVAGPMPLPGEAPGISEGPARELPFRIEITQQTELPILTVVTRAPTTAQARALAAAVPLAIGTRVRAIQDHQETPDGRRVEFRVLGPAQAGVVDNSSGKKIALGVFLVLLALFLAAIVGLPRFLAAWRSADAEPKAVGVAAGEGDPDAARPVRPAAVSKGGTQRKPRQKRKRDRQKATPKKRDEKPGEPAKPKEAEPLPVLATGGEKAPRGNGNGNGDGDGDRGDKKRTRG
jgi:hypothetical protein